jgi:SAM-dependent methyltransferase
VILSHQTIIEIPNPEKAFKEFRRILKKGGRLICLFLHPCFDFLPSDLKKKHFALTYFQKVKIEKGKYLVGGILSPFPYFYLHLSLSDWIEIFKRNGFSILNIKEPHPPLDFLKKKRWWRENFAKPRFILIEAKKT